MEGGRLRLSTTLICNCIGCGYWETELIGVVSPYPALEGLELLRDAVPALPPHHHRIHPPLLLHLRGLLDEVGILLRQVPGHVVVLRYPVRRVHGHNHIHARLHNAGHRGMGGMGGTE